MNTKNPKRPLSQAIVLLVIFVLLLILYGMLKGPSLDLTKFTLERQSGSFLLVSTLKSSLAMIEGSDIGIGFRLEVGDLVQSTYDLVDFAWKILLYGILLITFSKIFHESNIVDTGMYIMGIGFIVRIVSLFVHSYRVKMVSMGSGIIVAGLIASFYIPVSTLVSYRACEFFVDHIEKDLNEQLEEATKDWEMFREDLSLKEFSSSVRSGAVFVKDLFLKLTRILITFTCLLIIRYLLFPIIVAYGFFILSKSFLKKKFEQGESNR